MLLMLNRIWLLKTLFFFFDQVTILHQFPFVERAFIRSIRALKKQPVVFFTKTDEIHHLNKAVLYVRANESAGSIKFVHIYDKIEDIPERLEANHRVLDEIYPKIQIDLVCISNGGSRLKCLIYSLCEIWASIVTIVLTVIIIACFF